MRLQDRMDRQRCSGVDGNSEEFRGGFKFSLYNIFQSSVFRLDNWRGKCGNGGHIKVQTIHRLLSSTFLLGFLTLVLTQQRTDYYQNISCWFPDYSLVQRGREPDDGGEQQVLRLSSQLRAVPNGDRRLHQHHHHHHHHHH